MRGLLQKWFKKHKPFHYILAILTNHAFCIWHVSMSLAWVSNAAVLSNELPFPCCVCCSVYNSYGFFRFKSSKWLEFSKNCLSADVETTTYPNPYHCWTLWEESALGFVCLWWLCLTNPTLPAEVPRTCDWNTRDENRKKLNFAKRHFQHRACTAKKSILESDDCLTSL